MGRLKYFMGRILQMIPMVILTTLIVYFVLDAAPGDNLIMMWINPQQMKATPDKLQELYVKFGLDGPWYVRYFNWLLNLLKGNLGYSLISMRPVAWEISQRLGPSFLLVVLGQSMMYIIGIVLGVWAARNKYKFVDYLVQTLNYISMSLPLSWTLLMIMLIFVAKLGWFPSVGLHTLTLKNPTAWEYFIDTVKHLVLPVTIIAITGIGSIARLMRGSYLELRGSDFIRTARAKGVSSRDIDWKHIFRNGSLLVVSGFVAGMPMMILQTTLIESTFGIPGLGGYMSSAAFNRDYPAAMMCIFITALLGMLGTLLADLTMTIIDPRIGFSRKAWK